MVDRRDCLDTPKTVEHPDAGVHRYGRHNGSDSEYAATDAAGEAASGQVRGGSMEWVKTARARRRASSTVDTTAADDTSPGTDAAAPTEPRHGAAAESDVNVDRAPTSDTPTTANTAPVVAQRAEAESAANAGATHATAARSEIDTTADSSADDTTTADSSARDTTTTDDSAGDGAADGAAAHKGPRRRVFTANGHILQADWRAQLRPAIGVRERTRGWVAAHPVVGEIVGELRGGELRKVFWVRPKALTETLWERRPSRERVRRVLLERRVLIAGVAVVAVFVAADAQRADVPSDRPVALGEAQHVAIAYTPQLLPNPQSSSRLLAAIAAGEKRREAAVVAAAARATLERAKAEAAAAASGEWQDWMGQRAPVVPGVLVPGSTPSGGGFSLPAKGAFTSGFGSRWGTMHRGIDIAAPIGSPIYAVADGTVVEAGPAQGFGLWVRIRHDDGTISIYGHMYDFFVSQGERVPAGMQIARIGNRGDSTGPHLHFEIVQNGQHVDPQAWLALHGLSLT